jgi:hypothetical protein
VALTPGARFTQTQPVSAFSIGGQGPGASPVTLLTVPAGKTYRLWGVHLSLSVASQAAYAGTGDGVNSSIRDSLGNVYVDVEAFIADAGQTATNANTVDTRGAVLPAGTVVTMVMSAPAAGLGARMGGGAIWTPA